MNGFKKSDLKTGYILTFSDGLKGIIIKDINGDSSESLILYLSDRDETVNGYDYIDKVLDDDLHCYDGTFDVIRDLVSVEKLRNGYKLGSLLNPFDDDSITIDSIPKTFLLNRNKTLRKGDVFYTMRASITDGYNVGIYTIKDIYIEDNATFLVTTTDEEFNVKNVFFTKTEAEEAIEDILKSYIKVVEREQLIK